MTDEEHVRRVFESHVGKTAGVRVDPRRIVAALRENDEAHSELNQYEAPAGTLRERIQSVTGALDKSRTGLIARCEELEGALRRIAAGPRPDGTYNLSREACERIAREALDG